MADLVEEFGRLNDEQREAVRHPDNTVVLAGPGSGKTATLAVKICHLFQEGDLGPRGIACLTYNNECVQELRDRLRELGLRLGRRLFVGTVHSFCLNAVLRPYAALAVDGQAGPIRVASPKTAAALLEAALAKANLLGEDPQHYCPTLTRLRRLQACHVDTPGFRDEDPVVLADYRRRLAEAGLVDFEEMVVRALQLIEEHAWVRDLLAARYAWLVVDEYQDLGGPLDRIVTTLAERTAIKVFAVGDPDQTVYDFTGADPIYLERLARRSDFRTIRLRFNYRSGRRLIGAAQAALAPDEPRDYEPDPERTDLGEVYFLEADGTFEGHAALCVQEILPKLQADGVPAEQVAILYRWKGPLLSALIGGLQRARVPYLAERDGRYPSGKIVGWLKQCASWSVDSLLNAVVPFGSLLYPFHELQVQAGLAVGDTPSLATRSQLFRALTRYREPEMPLADWLKLLDEKLGLRELLAAATEYADELEAFGDLLQRTEPGGALLGYRLVDFAGDGRVTGKVVLTTLHSSKGRQFDVVILPGLVEGLAPRRLWNHRNRRYDEPAGPVLREDRRLFYVGFTRARKMVFLIHAESYPGKWDHTVSLGPSRFVREIQTRLADEEWGPRSI